MAQVRTNTVGLSHAAEDPANVGTVATPPIWVVDEPNDIGEAGQQNVFLNREPISATRQNKKGNVIDATAAVGFQTDATLYNLREYVPCFIFSKSAVTGATSLLAEPVRRPTSNTATEFNVPSGVVLPVNTLVVGRGFNAVANNGLHVVNGTPSATTIPVATTLTGGNVAPADNSTVEVAGFRADSGDLAIAAPANGQVVLSSTTLDFETLGLTAGQQIHIGGVEATNQFASVKGFARVVSVETNALTLDRLDEDLDGADAGAGVQVDLLFGEFFRNVAATDDDYEARSLTFEIEYPNLIAEGTPGYEYVRGNFCNELSISHELEDKATMDLAFVGTTAIATGTRLTGADAPRRVTQQGFFNNANQFVDIQFLNSDGEVITDCVKSLTITLGNSVTEEKCLGTLGAVSTNFGNFTVSVSMVAWFDSLRGVDAVINNETVSLSYGMRNPDGGFWLDIPSMSLGDGSKNFPRDETVTANYEGTAFEDPILGTSIGFSIFPILPELDVT